VEEAREGGSLRIQAGGGGKCFGPRAQLVFGTSKRGPRPLMPPQTEIFAYGSAQSHVVLT